jgi:pyruvate dehydrogenase E1 component beta subunit
MAELSMLQAINAALGEALAADPRVMIIGEDVGRLGGVFRATDGLQAKYGADRVVDMPLAEASIVGAALGLAVAGMRPIAEIQFLGFAHQAFHQIGQQVARMRFRSQGACPVPLVLRAAYGGGVRTPELHSDAFEAFYAHCPGLKVAAPATARDAKGLLAQAIADPDPVLFLEPLRGYRLVRDEVEDEPFTVPFGKLRVARIGSDVTLVAWSAAVQLALRAADALLLEGVSAEVLDLRTLAPFDVEGLAEAVRRTGRCIVIQEAPYSGGFGAEVAATVAEEAFYDLHAPVVRVAAPDTPYPLAAIEERYIPSVADVVAAARRTLEGT